MKVNLLQKSFTGTLHLFVNKHLIQGNLTIWSDCLAFFWIAENQYDSIEETRQLICAYTFRMKVFCYFCQQSIPVSASADYCSQNKYMHTGKNSVLKTTQSNCSLEPL